MSEELPNKEELLTLIDGEAEESTLAVDTEGEEGESEEYSEIELEAMQHGWKPEGVEGKRNLSAEEFMDRQKLYDDLRVVKKQNKRLQESFEALQKHQEHLLKMEREKVLKELKQQKREALENEEYDKVVEIDDQIMEASKEEEVAAPQPNVVFEEWVERNSWYNDDPEMREYADTIGKGWYINNPTKTPEEVYAYVEKQTKKHFRDKFEKSSKEGSPVEGAAKGRKKSTSTKYSERDLPEEAREIMRTLIRAGATTKEKYLKEYFAIV